MAVFNCSTSEIEEIVEFTVSTETNDQNTGELSVTDSLTIVGDQGVSAAVEDGAVKISIDPETFPEDLMGGDVIVVDSAEDLGIDHADGTTAIIPTGNVPSGMESQDGFETAQLAKKHGDKWYVVESGANIITADSEAELPDPSTLPENTMAFIPRTKEPVLSVNGETPDENGNVQVEVGVKSWNDLTDKPFGEEVEHLGDTLTWDGTPTDICVVAEGVYAYKVCDSTPSVDELKTGTLTIDQDGAEEQIVLYGDVYEQGETIIANISLIVLEDGAESAGVAFPQKGIYFVSAAGLRVKSLYIPGYDFVNADLKKLDKKYLPDDIGGLPPVTESDNGKFLRVVEGVIALVSLQDVSEEGM